MGKGEDVPAAAWQSGSSAAENARAVLPKLIKKFFRQGRRVMRQKNISPEELHQLRLKAKRVRYTLELFRPCYGPALRQRIEKLKRIQDDLGALNDCETTLGMVPSPARGGEESKSFRLHLENEIQRHIQDFIVHWREKFDAEGESDAWIRYLKNFAGRAGRKRATKPQASHVASGAAMAARAAARD